MIDCWGRDNPKEQCSTCRFYRFQWQCRRHAPITSLERPCGIHEPIWPGVRDDYWCGDFEPINGGVPA